MMLILVATSVIVLALLLMTVAFRPVRSPLSLFELNRRRAAGDRVAEAALKRRELLSELEALRQPVGALLLVVLTVTLLAALGWRWGSVVAVVVALLYVKVADTSLLQRWARKLYRSREETLLKLINRHKNKLRLLTGRQQAEPEVAAFSSPEELLHQISTSETILLPDDKKLLAHGLVFTKRRVMDVMTSRDSIVSISHTELLGPLVLSDLHKTGHSCFPVTSGDLNHVVGMLDIRDLLTLEAKRSVTAAKTMTGSAYYIRGDQTLDQALATFVRTRHHLLVVIDKKGATLGLLALRDVLESLFGRPMADEFASDSDLHLVARRQL